MGNNTHRNSVEEQRARQKELIELKRKKEAFEENPDEFQHEGPTEAVAQSTRSKLENFWYYSKFTIIGILIITIIFTVADKPLYVQVKLNPPSKYSSVKVAEAFII